MVSFRLSYYRKVANSFTITVYMKHAEEPQVYARLEFSLSSIFVVIEFRSHNFGVEAPITVIG